MTPASPQRELTPEETQRCRKILEYWHKVEFLLPYDLQDEVDKASAWSVRWIREQELREAGPEGDPRLWYFAPPKGRRITGFDLYLGIFDRSLLDEVTKALAPRSEEEEAEQRERADLEGPTCHARLPVDLLGRPEIDQLSVSCLPWALGRIQREGLAGLTFDSFVASQDGLKVDLANFRSYLANRPMTPSWRPGGSGQPFPLPGPDLKRLLDIFHRWSSLRMPVTTGSVIAIIARVAEVRSQEVKRPRATRKTHRPGPGAPGGTSATGSPSKREPSAIAGSGIEILNSFFARDIERVIAALDRGQVDGPLAAYLLRSPREDLVDLYTSAGRARILAALRPECMPSARWLGPPGQSMSLMQQFAINSAFGTLRDGGLLSVNGPPGTGKTTLLREIIAENITSRARVLASLGSSREAFRSKGPHAVSFLGEEEPACINVLRGELTGFEMVVASSNNAAVENVSEDLPKMKSLGEAAEGNPWRLNPISPTLSYLRPIAHRIALGMQKHIPPLAELARADVPWGLVSCPTGNRANQRSLAEALSSPWAPPGEDVKTKPPQLDSPEDDVERQRSAPPPPQSLWDWRDTYSGPTFAAARVTFREADDAVTARQSALIRYEALTDELHRLSETVERSQKEIEDRKSTVTALATELQSHRCLLTDLAREEELLVLRRPSLWARLLRRPSWQEHSRALAANRDAQLELTRRCANIQEQSLTVLASIGMLDKALAPDREALTSCREEWEVLRAKFPEAIRPSSPDGIEARSFQIDGVWRDVELNRLRSELFGAALALHEAWLGEVLQSGGGFGGNLVAVCRLLSGKQLADAADALPIWQSLFLLIPVVSSTFASIQSQFRNLGPGSLGWLFIDEAGQAVPQAAVGALWRSRRALVVGDPLQIEPVFSAPLKVIDTLHRHSGLPDGLCVNPHRVSVQTLADEANAIGARIRSDDGSHDLWIGSPLRVHRRCHEPMFGIANEIAYSENMISAVGDRPPLPDRASWGASAWVDVGGTATNKHVVPEQIDLVVKAIEAFHGRWKELPALYIISPFRSVKRALISGLKGSGSLPQRELKNWGKRIGTVHTFQGKEEDTVWMVLGCDAKASGAVSWAASKPNLLNVAVTRAHHSLFIIGDRNLWGGRKYFDVARRTLPVIAAQELVQRIAAPAPRPRRDNATAAEM